ncbi:MAG: glycosyltransferase [Nitrososphaera sp.]|nr:glycosyltransferase [Nitrososphaera sp.]
MRHDKGKEGYRDESRAWDDVGGLHIKPVAVGVPKVPIANVRHADPSFRDHTPKSVGHSEVPYFRKRKGAMNVLHVTSTISTRGGGVASYVWGLAGQQARAGIKLTIAGIDDGQTGLHIDASCGEVVTAPHTGPRALGWSKLLARQLASVIPEMDLVHIHALRAVLNRDVRRIAVRNSKPLIISPHGQLYPQVLARNRVRKALLARLFVDADLKAASCLHATSRAEAEYIKSYGVRRSVAVIPIGVDADAFHLDVEQARDAVDGTYPALRGYRRILVLTLLHPKKGLERLAIAWGQVSQAFKQWRLVIAGPDDGYEAQSRAAFALHAPGDSVLWVGPVYGREKAELLAGCDLLVLPSDWENFGIVVIEALASGIPVIATSGSPWEELSKRACGWWIRPTVEVLAKTLTTAMATEQCNLRSMGERGRQLAYENYTWDRCAAQMIRLYETIIRGEKWPGFVQ